jgi:hypothetical protein
MTEEKKINFNINDGEAFYAHELSVNFNPMQFIFDFKCVTPRIDVRNREGTVINLKHNVVLVEPYHAKKIVEVLSTMIAKYEKDFGKIEKPKALAKLEKMNNAELKKIKSDEDKTVGMKPTYLG